MTTSVSVVIRCFNEERHIGRLLFGISKQSVQPQEIIIVDSGSTDATLSIATRFPVRVVTIQPSEFSFGRALNIGCRVATGEALVFASAHVYPLLDTWLELLVAPLSESDVALAYGRQVGDDRTKFSERRLLGKLFRPHSVRRQTHPFCNNANAAVRRGIWERQPYDETLTGLEDLDWARKAMAGGYGISYVAEAAIAHIHEESDAQVLNRYRREAIALGQMFPEQRIGALDAVRLGTASILSDYYAAAREHSLLRHLASIPAFRVAQFLGTYRGFQERGPVTDALRRHFYYPEMSSPSPRPMIPPTAGRPIVYEEMADHGSLRTG